MSELKVHPVADLFPMLSDAELQELANDILHNGQQTPCVVSGDILIDGRNRLAACRLVGVKPKFTEFNGESVVGFIVSVNLRRRHLDKSQKVALAVEIEQHFAREARERQRAAGDSGKEGGRGKKKTLVRQCSTRVTRKSRDQAASAVGISGKLLQKVKAIRKSRPDLFDKIISGKLSVAKAEKIAKADSDRKALEEAQKEIDFQKRQHIASVCDLRQCTCEELFASGVKPDVVITDPPYPEEFLECFTELAIGCAAAAVPIVAVMSGQSYLPEVYKRLSDHLRYRWTLAYLTPGGQAVQQWSAKVNTFWKPVLLFGEAGDWIGDVSTSRVNDNDKRFHGWGQSESGMLDLVSRLSKPGDLVCDPFLGGGTTAVASLALGRRFVGCDIYANHIQSTQMRVEAMECAK